MGYSFYGGRKGNGWVFATPSNPSGFHTNETIVGRPTSTQVSGITNIQDEVQYGEYCIVNSAYIYQRVLAASADEEWRFIAPISQGTINISYDLAEDFGTTVMVDYKTANSH